MWVISGPFDGKEKNEIGFKSRFSALNICDSEWALTIAEAKLLKTGSKYALGRKERQLTVNHAKVSHDHGAVAVAAYSQNDVVSFTSHAFHDRVLK
jgi:hypothetical protein